MINTNIVVVEDDVLLAKHIIRTLEKAGYTAHHDRLSIVAIDMIDELKPAVIFLDVLLTVSTGLVLLHVLR